MAECPRATGDSSPGMRVVPCAEEWGNCGPGAQRVARPALKSQAAHVPKLPPGHRTPGGDFGGAARRGFY